MVFTVRVCNKAGQRLAVGGESVYVGAVASDTSVVRALPFSKLTISSFALLIQPRVDGTVSDVKDGSYLCSISLPAPCVRTERSVRGARVILLDEVLKPSCSEDGFSHAVLRHTKFMSV